MHRAGEGEAGAMDRLIVNFGIEHLRVIPGRISTEVDASLSYDAEGTVSKARRLIGLYEEKGFAKHRVLIKVASTWEGIQAARTLEAEWGIHCNCTLLFSLVQAVACAEAGVTLISPFVGRILDWYKKNEPSPAYEADVANCDPGVVSVRTIYNYLKHYNYNTVVMGASFRSAAQIVALAGVDLLTISPKLLDELSSDTTTHISAFLSPAEARAAPAEAIGCRRSYVDDKAAFARDLAADRMASELLTDGIKRFDQDAQTLSATIRAMF